MALVAHVFSRFRISIGLLYRDVTTHITITASTLETGEHWNVSYDVVNYVWLVVSFLVIMGRHSCVWNCHHVIKFSLAQVTLFLHLSWIWQYCNRSKSCQYGGVWGTPVVHRVERVPLRLRPYRSDPSSIPVRGPSLHALPSLSHNFLSISLYSKA